MLNFFSLSSANIIIIFVCLFLIIQNNDKMLLSKWIKWMRMLNTLLLCFTHLLRYHFLSVSHVHSAASFMNGRSIKKTLLWYAFSRPLRSCTRGVYICSSYREKMIFNQTCCYCANTLQTMTATNFFHE